MCVCVCVNFQFEDLCPQFSIKQNARWKACFYMLCIDLWQSVQYHINSCHVMLRSPIHGLICRLGNYIFINCKTSYLSAQWSDFYYIKVNRGTQGRIIYKYIHRKFAFVIICKFMQIRSHYKTNIYVQSGVLIDPQRCQHPSQ